MGNPFFERPILNSPYDYPTRIWELDSEGQPTQQIAWDTRDGHCRPAESYTREAIQSCPWPLVPRSSATA